MKRLYGALALLALAILAAATGVAWLVGTEDGLRWAAAQAGERLAVEDLRGRLAGEVSFGRLTYTGEGIRLEAREGSLRAHLAALLGGRLTLDPVHAASLEVELHDGQTKSGAPRLPLRLHIAHARFEALEVRRGAMRHRFSEVTVDHASLGRELSLSGAFAWPHERFAARAQVQLRGSLERIEAQLAGDVAGIPGEARAVLTPYSTERLRSLEARAGPLDLARFDPALPRTSLTAAISAEGGAGGALAGALSLVNADPGPLDAGRLPLARLETRFFTDFAAARLERARATLHGGATVQGDAELTRGRAHGKLVASAVDLRALHSRLRRTALHGPFEVLLEGETQWARGSLTQEGMGLTAEVVRAGKALEVRELRALAEGGEVSGTGTISLTAAKPFTAKLQVKHFNPAAFGDYPAGALSGELSATGRLEPRRIDLSWNLRDSQLYGHAFRSEGSARLAGERVTQADADLRLGANRLTARGAYGRPGDELAVALDAPRLEQFAPLAGSLRARGTLSGSLANPRAALSADATALTLPGGMHVEKMLLKLNGTLGAHDAEIVAQAPGLAVDLAARLRGGWSAQRGWTGELRSLSNSGAYPLELIAPAALTLAPRRVELGRLEARLAAGRILIRDAAWSPARFASSGEFAGLPAQWLFVAARLDQRLRSTLLLDGEWDLIKTKEIQGLARARRAAGDLALRGEDPIELGLERASLEVRFGGGRAAASAEVVARAGRAQLRGEVMPALALQGKIEFAELRALAGPLVEGARVDGRLSAELAVSGTLASPRVHGALAGEGLAFELPLYGFALRDGRLAATLDGASLRIESLTLRGREGRLTASGTLPLALDGRARVEWRAEKLAVLERPDMRLVVSGGGEASYDGARAALSGDLRADRGRFEFERARLPQLGEDVQILGQERPAPKGKPRLPLALDLRLDLGDNLVVRAYGFDGKVAGLVDLATTEEGELRAFGRLHAVNATFLAYGQKLEVDPGALVFDGPIENPSLQITAWRRKQAVEAGVQITGTVRAPSVQLVSQPPVPESERLSWLVLGRPPSGATHGDLGLLQAAAGALLAGGDSMPLDRRIARRFGLDEVSLRGSGEVADRVVAVGKRLSDRLYISYEQGLGAIATNLVKLDYALGRRWTLRAETGSSSGGGLFYRYSWD